MKQHILLSYDKQLFDIKTANEYATKLQEKIKGYSIRTGDIIILEKERFITGNRVLDYDNEIIYISLIHQPDKEKLVKPLIKIN